MGGYTIVIDSASDLASEYAEKHGLTVIKLQAFCGAEEVQGYGSRADDAWVKNLYARLRKKESVTTSAVNSTEFEKVFTEILESGKDVLYIGFSSGLSATYDFARKTAIELQRKYPDRKVYAVDTLCAAYGEALIVDYAVRMREGGSSIDDIYRWLEKNKLHICSWVTVDDLFFLKRGGRVSAATAIAGTALGIKPIIHLDNDGKLIPVAKVRGRQASLEYLVDRMEATAIDPREQRVFIGHGDCVEDAEKVRDMIKKRFGTKEFDIEYIKPVIGAHSGPGCIALFFFGTER